MSLKDQAQTAFALLQDVICARLELLDGKATFRQDQWQHASGGGGRSRVMEQGRIFEKAGVNFSAVTSDLPPPLAARLHVEPQTVFATGVSLVLHPASPLVPATHLNLRYLEMANGDAWFGGGTDLTPWYLFEEDATHFHAALKAACDRHDPEYYTRFKQWCDEYFYIRHRGETRGIGGIFFDYLRGDLPSIFNFVRDIGLAFPGAYLPIVERRAGLPWTPAQKQWQLIRRGRYVEFNLVYDRGTVFGLETGGRTESILMSLPPEVRWVYDHTPEPGTPEAELVTALQHPRAWL